MTFKKAVILALSIITITSCAAYSFTNINIGTAKTFEVSFFQNRATNSAGSTISPGLDNDFTNALQDLISNQTSLNFTRANADLVYQGEIIEYRIAPMTATANQTAAQNRLTMTVNVRFHNNTKENADFEKPFSFFYDFPANTQFSNIKSKADDALFERITQDIINVSLEN